VPPTLADRLEHILAAIRGIEELLAKATRAGLAEDRHSRLAFERELEIISEASRKIPDAIKAGRSEIDWSGMAALGNRLRHAYHRIDIAILWEIAVRDLPPLKTFVEEVIRAGKDRQKSG
jgi:uncharacterized protein with HEPN domain